MSFFMRQNDGDKEQEEALEMNTKRTNCAHWAPRSTEVEAESMIIEANENNR